MKNFKQLREAVDRDVSSMDDRAVASIANNPKHPMHSAAKAEHDRRKMKQEAKDPEEYDNEGSMMKSQLRQICSANEKLMGMVKDDENLPEWVQSKVTKATDYIRSVRDYLESEKMEEKTLTPAEMKKREEIAQAIKRDNPDMPMAKKMAIATAQAKKVAEGKAYGPTGVSYYVPSGHKDEVDPKTGKKYPERQKPGYKNPSEAKVNEISIDKLSRYGKAAAKDIEKHRNTVRTALDQPASPKKAKAGLASMQRLTRRSKGSDMYVDKMTGRSKVKPSVSTVGKDKQVSREGKK